MTHSLFILSYFPQRAPFHLSSITFEHEGFFLPFQGSSFICRAFHYSHVSLRPLQGLWMIDDDAWHIYIVQCKQMSIHKLYTFQLSCPPTFSSFQTFIIMKCLDLIYIIYCHRVGFETRVSRNRKDERRNQSRNLFSTETTKSISIFLLFQYENLKNLSLFYIRRCKRNPTN